MATGFFQSISNALGGKSNAPAQDESSAPTQVYDSQGNPVSEASGNNNSNTDSSSVRSDGANTPSVEDLLFAPESTGAEGSAAADGGTNAGANQSAQTSQTPAPVELAPGLSAQQLLQNLSSVNYMGAVPQETITNALGGDVDAFNSVMSSVAQLSAAIAVKQSLDSSKALLDERFKSFDSSLESKISESKYSEVLADPQFSNPFVRPLAESLMTRLRERDPSITPQQIKETLPKLIEYSMQQYSGATGAPKSSAPANVSNPFPRGTPGASVPTEINFDEVFKS